METLFTEIFPTGIWLTGIVATEICLSGGDELSRPEIYPFTKMSWRSRQIEEKWEPIRERVNQACYFAEYESVRRGYRNCDVYDLNPNNFDNQIKKVMLDGLVYLPILRSKTYGGYGHRHYVANTIDENTFIYGVVARNLNDAIRFHDAGVTDLTKRIKDDPAINPHGIDHEVTGTLLGYPECDRRFFNETWLRDGCLDPMFETATHTDSCELVSSYHVKVEGEPMLNRMARYFGFQIVTFFPHSFDCKEALKFGDMFIELMREYDEEATDACMEVLSVPMKWSMANMVTYVEHPLFIGASNGYYTKEKLVVEWLPTD